MVTEQPSLESNPIEENIIAPSVKTKISLNAAEQEGINKEENTSPLPHNTTTTSNHSDNKIIEVTMPAAAQKDETATFNGDHPESSINKRSIDEVPQMLAEGKKQAALSNWDVSLDLLSTAVEIMNEKHGELAPECADAYFIYGKTLLTAAVSRANALGGVVTTTLEEDVQQDTKLLESVHKQSDRCVIEGDDAAWNDEGEEGDDEVEEEATDGEANADAAPVASEENETVAAAEVSAPEKDDMELAFEVLDMCRVIYSKMESPESLAKLGDVHLMLGDIALDGGHFKEAIKDYVMAISLKQLVNAPHRELAEAHYKLALPLEYEAQYDEAIKHVKAVMDSIEARIAQLKQELEALSADEKGKGKANDISDERVLNITESTELEGVIIEMNEKIQDLKRQKALNRPGFLDAPNEGEQESFNGSSTATEPAVVHDLSASGLVKSKKIVSNGNSASSSLGDSNTAIKRKNEEDQIEGSEAKKLKIESSTQNL